MKELRAQPVLDTIRPRQKDRTLAFTKRAGRPPKLVVVLVGEDPASVIYTTRKGEAAAACGMAHETLKLPATSSAAQVRDAVARLNADPSVDGILIQRPLPRGFDENEVMYWVDPAKDVDVFHPENVGKLVLSVRANPALLEPCTPAGVMRLLHHYNIEVPGRVACVVGRSSIVGKPMASLLLQADATVIQCHSRTQDLSRHTREAEILVIAAGKPEMIRAEHIRPGATVIDVGIHRRPGGGLCGDVHFESARSVAGAITPVPGGVGPMTIAVLIDNTLTAAESRESGN